MTTASKHLLTCSQEENLKKSHKVRMACPPDKFDKNYKNIPFTREAVCVGGVPPEIKAAEAESEKKQQQSSFAGSEKPICNGTCVCDN